MALVSHECDPTSLTGLKEMSLNRLMTGCGHSHVEDRKFEKDGSKQKVGVILTNEACLWRFMRGWGDRRKGKILKEDSGSKIVFRPRCSPTWGPFHLSPLLVMFVHRSHLLRDTWSPRAIFLGVPSGSPSVMKDFNALGPLL